MLFNSFEFLLFLPIVFAGYWFVFRGRSVQNLFVVAASYIFYGWWDMRFLLLIFLTTLLCFGAGRMIRVSQSRSIRKWICGLNIAANVAILCFFKYFDFFSENLLLLFSQFGYQLDWFTLDVLLPVGISFYTFQAISYPIDVYRGKIGATTDFVAFTAFISFFPQLVAGPIERSTNLLPQFLHKRTFDYSRAVDGCRQMLWGFFKKIVIADNCAMFANTIFADYANCTPAALWLGAFLFTFQIYGDFSGYSDIAIGVAKLFGVELKRNFHYPYFSRDIAEFWRRWHISLNTWFRDYVYIPLGGSRCSKAKVLRNTMIIFLLSGLWHGANWTFIIWGAFHGLLFLPLIVAGKNRRFMDAPAAGRIMPSVGEFLSMAVTFVLVMMGWIMFRADNVAEGFGYIKACFVADASATTTISALLAGSQTQLILTIFSIAVLQLTDWTQRAKSFGLQICEGRPAVVRWGIYIALIFIIIVFAGEQAQFIYFQF